MTLVSTMKSEIAVFMAMKKGSWVFQHIFMEFHEKEIRSATNSIKYTMSI